MDNDTNTLGSSETPNSNPTPVSPTPSPVKKSKAGKIVLGIVLALVVLAGGLAAGYYVGQLHKNQEVETAKKTAKEEAKKEHEGSTTTPAKETPAKTVTETTCNADELTLSTAENQGSGAGTLSYDIVLTNTGSRTCTLGGYPGVSLVNDNGNQIGSPAERTTNIQEKTLTLTPNAKVRANVYTSNPDNFDAGECKEGATKLRVYPPNDTGYLSVATETTSWCPGFEISPVMEM